jgi:hypothetical protein
VDAPTSFVKSRMPLLILAPQSVPDLCMDHVELIPIAPLAALYEDPAEVSKDSEKTVTCPHPTCVSNIIVSNNIKERTERAMLIIESS